LAFLVRWGLVAASVALTAWVLPDVALEGGVWPALWVALLIGLANTLAQLLLALVPRPSGFWLLLALTLVVNALLVWGVSALTSYLTVDGFVAAVGTAMLITVFSVALTSLLVRVLPDDEPRHRTMTG
jgi:putative membrane protein